MALTQVSQAMGGTGTSSVAGSLTNTNIATTQSINSINTFGFKNRIINGDMRIAQRGTSATNPTANGYTTIDRLANWAHPSDTSSWTISQSTSAPTGFQYSALVTASNVAYTIGNAGSYNTIHQVIEGVNCADLMWGTANAKTCTFSFWVNCSLTGTFSGYFYNNGYNYCYPFTYTISTANTWTYITITVPGPTGGTWLTNTGLGIEVGLTLSSGSAYQGTANTWQSAGYKIAVANTVNVLATSGATFYTTGWQFEVGTQATSFDFRDYTRELQMCQRYYYRIQALSGTGGVNILTVNLYTYQSGYSPIILPVAMRANPTGSYSAVSDFYVGSNGSYSVLSSITANNGSASPNLVEFYWFTASNGTSGQSGFIRINNTTGWLAYSAEILN